MKKLQHNTTQHNTTQHNTTQHISISILMIFLYTLFSTNMNAQNYPSWYKPTTCATPTAKANSRSAACSATTPYFTSNTKNIPSSGAPGLK